MLYLMCGQISKEGLFHRSRDAGGDAYDCHEAGRARHPGRRHCFWDEVEPFHCFWMGAENTGATGAGTRPQSSVSMEETPFAPDRAIRYRMPWFDPLWRRGFVCIDSSYRQDLDVSRQQADCSSFWKARCSCWRYIGGQPTRTPPFPTLSGEF